ncbi:MAG: PadR family transcriptional regulator [Thermoprotei archaeon]|nr:MAG: PadR family transcriptional regulator [Thermoprotei archaeon]
MAYQRLVKKMTIENLWMYILRLLVEKPMYGGEIIQALRERFGIKSAAVTIYVVLYRMEREGLIKKVKEDKKRGKRDGRAYYKPTIKGIKTLEQGLEFIKSTYMKLQVGEKDVNEIQR